MSEVNNVRNENPQPTPSTEGGFDANGLGTVKKTLSMSGGSKTGPGFSGSYTLELPAGNYYEISVSADDSATVSGGGISASSHWDATKKKIIPGSASSEEQPFPAGSKNVTFSVDYENVGGPYVLSVSVSMLLLALIMRMWAVLMF